MTLEDRKTVRSAIKIFLHGMHHALTPSWRYHKLLCHLHVFYRDAVVLLLQTRRVFYNFYSSQKMRLEATVTKVFLHSKVTLETWIILCDFLLLSLQNEYLASSSGQSKQQLACFQWISCQKLQNKFLKKHNFWV